MSETWVWNENPNFDRNQTFENISFTSNAKLYTSIKIYVGILNKVAYDGYTVYNIESLNWTNEAYRTITFSTAPTGDLLTLLQANAVKQSTGGIGLKNLSSYNQDLSIPRKKDLDALETKVNSKQPTITVNGIVQGDGAGNLSAAETVNADLLDLNPTAVGLGNVDNVKQYSVSNPPPYPVTSVNGKTGNVTIDIPVAGTSISTSGTQPTGQSTGDYWYRITGRANM